MEKNVKILETDRLILRAWSRADIDSLFEIMRDARVMRYLADGLPFTFEQVEDFLIWAEHYQIENNFCRWKVIERSTGEVIGSCGFARTHATEEVELGYLLAQKHWGKGLATEAARAAMLYGFGKLNFREIIAMTDLENVRSQKVLEKIGFARRGIEVYEGAETLVYLARNPEIIL